MSFEFEPMSKMSAARFREYGQELLGLPVPPDNAPKDEIIKWGVAGMFLTTCRDVGVAEGKLATTNFLLESSKEDDELMPLGKVIPHIEQALGRKLTVDELDQRFIVRV